MRQQRPLPRRLAGIGLIALFVSASFSAGEPAAPAALPATRPSAEPVDADGFAPIFDGKTLAGWAAPDMSYWRVEDNAITGEVTVDHKPKENVFLVWQGEPVGDFELKFRFRIFGKLANSGMQFRSEVKERGLVHGYQADIDGAGKFAAGIWDEYGPRRSLAARGERARWDAAGTKHAEPIPDPFEGKPADLTEWTEYHIVARGEHVSLRVNGKLACELLDGDKARQRLKGILAVPVIPQPMKVQYTDIRLKRL